MTDDAPIVVSAAVLRDASDRILLVRKRGTQRFMLPGGKPEPGESPVQTVLREVAEEVGVTPNADSVVSMGRIRAVAANEPGRSVLADVFDCGVLDPAAVDSAAAAQEIAELRWHEPVDDARDDLAPLFVDHVLPLLRGQAR